MTKRTRSSIHAVAGVIALAAATGAAGQVPGPERIEVVQTAEGLRPFLAGIARGTPFAEAAERLGGVGALNALFGGSAPIFHQGEIDGLKCSMLVSPGDAGDGAPDRVQGVMLACEGGRFALWRLARRFRAALAALPVQDGWYGTFPTGAMVRVEPTKAGSWWEQLLAPHELRVTIR